MKKFSSLLAFALVLLAMHICCRKYHGDGTFRKYRLFSNHCRYEVDFGQIRLDRLSDQTYNFSAVPSSDYWLCLRLGPVDLNRTQAEDLNKVIREIPEGKVELSLSLSDGTGNVVVQAHGPLSAPSWHWSETRISNFPAQADGTAQFYFSVYPKVNEKEILFKLKSGERYSMRAAIVHPSEKQERDVILLLQGGFWK